MSGQELPYAFELSQVSRRYGRRWALAHISFSLPQGGSLLLTGHNGSGKSTLLGLLATALTPTAGSLKILGWDSLSHRDQIRPRVALVSHASFLYEDLSAAQNLSLLGQLLKVPDCKNRVSAVLDRVGLASRATHPVRQFSAGMRKRLTIARLLLKRPDLALLDEPFGELDPAGMLQMEELIRELVGHGTSVVLATHWVDQGQALCQRRLHLQEGRQVEVA